MSDGRIYNVNDIGDPLKRQGKGRPPAKRLKAYNEQAGSSKVQKENVYKENIDNTCGRRCGLCHEIGHYAPKCPNKKN